VAPALFNIGHGPRSIRGPPVVVPADWTLVVSGK